MIEIFDARRCRLGEGPLWHPLRNQLFWFDILKCRLYSLDGRREFSWQFERSVSAAGWINHDHLLIADSASLFEFNVETGQQRHVVDLEADNPMTRSNDGRADPWGGFWIGTMGYNAESRAGAIYRFYKGEIKQLFSDITISNAICFDASRSVAYFTDTPTGKIWRQPLSENGWPVGSAELFLDLEGASLNPDGAVTDSAGNIWIAFWGDCSVRCYSTDGEQLHKVELPTSQPSCPAFGGAEFNRLIVTTAKQGLPDAEVISGVAGSVFAINVPVFGKAEPAVEMLTN